MVEAKKCTKSQVLRGEQVFHPVIERPSDKEIDLDPRATIIGQWKKQYIAWLPVLAITTAKVFNYTHARLYTQI